jgi:hypothetical protein
VTGRPNLQANFIQQSSLMLALALGVESQCGPAVLADTDPAYFHCWDMASPEALSPGGDFVPDGEVNVLDYGRQVRLQNLTGLGVNTFMLLSQAGAVLTPSGALEGPSDCARRRRNLAATIVANWHVSCPSESGRKQVLLRLQRGTGVPALGRARAERGVVGRQLVPRAAAIWVDGVQLAL